MSHLTCSYPHAHSRQPVLYGTVRRRMFSMTHTDGVSPQNRILYTGLIKGKLLERVMYVFLFVCLSLLCLHMVEFRLLCVFMYVGTCLVSFLCILCEIVCLCIHGCLCILKIFVENTYCEKTLHEFHVLCTKINFSFTSTCYRNFEFRWSVNICEYISMCFNVWVPPF